MSIWDHKELKKYFELSEYISLGEGNTSVDEFAVDGLKIFLKREDKNPTESWKDRATALKVSQMISDNVREAVLFSSGNALISMLEYLKDRIFKLHCVVSENIEPSKLEIIKDLVNNTYHELHISQSPKQEAVKISAQYKIPNLRSSLDNDVAKAYWSLGYEIFDILKRLDIYHHREINENFGVFMPASSGTSFVGSSEGLFSRLEEEYMMPKMFAVQTTKVHTFVEKSLESVDESLADAIVDTVGLRKPQVHKIVKETNGNVFAVTNEELKEAENFLKENKVADKFSYNSLLSVAGFLRARKKGMKFRYVVCVMSGR